VVESLRGWYLPLTLLCSAGRGGEECGGGETQRGWSLPVTLLCSAEHGG